MKCYNIKATIYVNPDKAQQPYIRVTFKKYMCLQGSCKKSMKESFKKFKIAYQILKNLNK